MDDSKLIHNDTLAAWCERRGWVWTAKCEAAFSRIAQKTGPLTSGHLEKAAEVTPILGDGTRRSAMQLAYNVMQMRGISPRPLPSDNGSMGPPPSQPVSPEQAAANYQDLVGALRPAWVAHQKKHGRSVNDADWQQVLADGRELTDDRCVAEAEAERLKDAENPALLDARMHTVCLGRMGAPPELMRLMMDSESGRGEKLHAWPAMEFVRRWTVRGRKPATLVISGPARIGKTTAAMLPLYEDAKTLRPATACQVYWPCVRLAGHCVSNYEDARAIMHSLYTVKTLVIDNLVRSDDMDPRLFRAFASRLLEVIDQRKTHGLSTLILTNESRDTLISSFGDVFASHLHGDRGYFFQAGTPRPPPSNSPSGRTLDYAHSKGHSVLLAKLPPAKT